MTMDKNSQSTIVDEPLRRLTALLDAATPGPWMIEGGDSFDEGVEIVNREHDGIDWDICTVHSTEANAQLIAAAINHLRSPEYAQREARIAELEAELARVKAQRDTADRSLRKLSSAMGDPCLYVGGEQTIEDALVEVAIGRLAERDALAESLKGLEARIAGGVEVDLFVSLGKFPQVVLDAEEYVSLHKLSGQTVTVVPEELTPKVSAGEVKP